MVRRVFFSFHYERDIWRANQVRNSWVTKPDRQSAGFWDAAEWETVKGGGKPGIRKWIDDQMKNTSVTVVLIGSETCDREWVRYEIEKSIERGNGVIGIKIHNQKDKDGNTCEEGDTDFGKVDGENSFEDLFPVYDWDEDNGYENIGDWIDAAALVAGRPALDPPEVRYIDPQDCIR